MDNNYCGYYDVPGLYHHGVQGMKWGVRRYQNKNGSLTPAGRKRYISDKNEKTQKEIDALKAKQSSGKSSNPAATDKRIKALEDKKLKNAEKYGKKYDKAADKVNREVPGEDYGKARAKSVKQMSDQELRNALNRVQMEKQYKSLTATEKSSGQKWVESLLSESAKGIAKDYMVKYGKKAIDAMLEKSIDALAKKS